LYTKHEVPFEIAFSYRFEYKLKLHQWAFLFGSDFHPIHQHYLRSWIRVEQTHGIIHVLCQKLVWIYNTCVGYHQPVGLQYTLFTFINGVTTDQHHVIRLSGCIDWQPGWGGITWPVQKADSTLYSVSFRHRFKFA
jgi:hypothetical protein